MTAAAGRPWSRAPRSPANGAVQLFKDVAAALPEAKPYGPDGIAESGFSDPAEGGIPAAVQERTKVTVATLAPEEYSPEGREFFSTFEEKYGEANPDPYSIYGYEAMQLTLDAIARSDGSRQGVIDAVLDTKGRESVLGTLLGANALLLTFLSGWARRSSRRC